MRIASFASLLFIYCEKLLVLSHYTATRAFLYSQPRLIIIRLAIQVVSYCILLYVFIGFSGFSLWLFSAVNMIEIFVWKFSLRRDWHFCVSFFFYVFSFSLYPIFASNLLMVEFSLEAGCHHQFSDLLKAIHLSGEMHSRS